MRRILKIVAAVLAVLVLARFAYVHAGQRVDLHFGLFTLRGVSLSVVMYGSLILGMIVVLAVGLRHDLRERHASVGRPAQTGEDDPGASGGARIDSAPGDTAAEAGAPRSSAGTTGPEEAAASESDPGAGPNEAPEEGPRDGEGQGGSGGAGPLFEGVDRKP